MSTELARRGIKAVGSHTQRASIGNIRFTQERKARSLKSANLIQCRGETPSKYPKIVLI